MAEIVWTKEEISTLAYRIAEIVSAKINFPVHRDLPPRKEKRTSIRADLGQYDAADKKYGYKFGADGLMSFEEVKDWLGGVSRSTIEQLGNDGKIRRGRTGRKLMFCARSVQRYAASIEV